ncbi:MAG TPA: type I methionyl aminopeptidase [Syntrophales bacterium]|nr:type I methionyl aminopeptidase [Syntrophales bacterium]HON22772.1 type I methionyl aminopeptidase [Syntrophales bacterium]HOU77986.1 type I methionyl aminopeptidase [Syntrophales bacterium]HPC32183.1 type I methionyl aminopeptidase [Syntrophales bacterium]HQG33915.1 type I methionyl aminopeptidase [Syntrophales bacterium]
MVILKQQSEIEKIRASNLIVAEVLAMLKEKVVDGITTRELDRLSEELVLRRGAKPAFKGYRGYPYSLCASVNDEIIHGLPSDRVLREGDIVGLDFGAYYGGYYGDAALTVPVGKISPEAAHLLQATERSLALAIEEARVGNRLGDISAAVQNHVEAAGYSVVRDFVGHGIGRSLHEEPQIPNFGVRGRGVKLKAGMVLAIEPMVNAGTFKIRMRPDGWTAVTADGRLSAHFEHTVAITENGPEILSRLH